jgi:hypothetical protein
VIAGDRKTMSNMLRAGVEYDGGESQGGSSIGRRKEDQVLQPMTDLIDIA